MKPVTQQSASELLVLLRTNKISALELADEYIRQIERLNPQTQRTGGLRRRASARAGSCERSLGQSRKALLLDYR